MPDPITLRFCRVLAEVYNNDLARMATELGVNQTTCFRYRKGDVVPPLRTLRLISEKAHVNLTWLQNGGGEQIVFDEQSSLSAITEYGLPVLRAPSETTPAMAHEALVAPPTYYDKKRYWLKMAEDMAAYSLKAGDHVLIEVCDSRPAEDSDNDRLCILKRKGKLALEMVTPKDCQGKERPTVHGLAVLLHRDLLA